MNPADGQQGDLQPQPGMQGLNAMREIRHIWNLPRQRLEAQAGDNDIDPDEEHPDNHSDEDILHGFLRTVANKERTLKKNRFAELLSRKKKSVQSRQKIACQRQWFRAKRTPVLLVECISVLFNNPRLSDVTLKVGPQLFHSHKLILCAWSEVFRSLTDQRWASSSSAAGREPQVQMLSEPEGCQECFKDFLQFMYTEKVELTEENVYPILTLADKYLVHDLRDVCEEYLLVLLDSPTRPWMSAMKAIELTEGLPKVQEKSFSLLENNFYSWTIEDDFMSPSSPDVSKDLLVRLLESSNLVVPNEMIVFEIVLQWLSGKNCPAGREEFTEQMLSLVRFEHMSAADLATLVDHCPPALRPRMNENVFEALKARALAGEESYLDMGQEFTNPRVYMEPKFCVRITNSECRIEPEIPFKELSLFTDDDGVEFKKYKLTCPVARQSEEQNIYLINNDVWDIGGFAMKQDGGEWSVRYIVRPHFDDIGRSYRMAVLAHETGIEEEQMLFDPITCVDSGDVGKEITIDLPSTGLECHCNPGRLWIQVAIYVSGCDKSWDK